MAALLADAGLEIGEEALPVISEGIGKISASVGVGIGSIAAGVGVGIEKASEVVEHIATAYEEITDQPKKIEENISYGSPETENHVSYGSNVMAEKSIKDGQYNSFQNPISIQRPNIPMVPPVVNPATIISSPEY